MERLQDAKRLVLAHYDRIEASSEESVTEAIAEYTAPDCAFRFVHPFDDRIGAAEAADAFWAPLMRAFAPLQRRQDIFFAGANYVDAGETTWVVSMGHLLGLFDRPWLGLRPTRQAAMLRYAEFHEVFDGKIVECVLFLDILNLMHQARAESVPATTAATMVTPGPRTHDGLLFGPHPPGGGGATMELILRMIDRLIAADVRTTREDLALDWTADMVWWGPGGIGAPYTQERYVEQHARPFEDGFEWRGHCGHRVRCAEGAYGGFFGWPSFLVRSKGGYLGLAPAADEPVSMRVVDLYRREGDLLAENWNFIDQLDVLDQLGVDLIGRQKMLTGV